MAEFEHDIDTLTLVPSRGGVFEVTVDDDLIFSKKATGKHATYEGVAGPIRART